ncbi:BZ3500_MvSof-1268-A1-R1_Chr6-1g08366 [Microbotryum saponariae]|uniref:BZ3500_MvSof-1268-A1-R1_Chr6-1g08366 protein n=1 Tax=Microbotryum saponariae TaxID=289078 RepID=A0A2X0LQ56_9BASI|nr:BZ3500_MvSof-1268-A1-R1_Chr6-1g08366 [Microbotryum saponariae]SDA07650.1 BZ3501_MvSof-1269-A2-R1_Chr6-1g08087 [Microbotryum saponariae]
MPSANEATPIVSTNSRPPTLTRLLATCAPSERLKWDSPASPGVRVLSSFFDLLEQHPSLLELFREKLDAISNAPCSEMARKSEDDVRLSFEELFFGGLRSATAALLNHHAAITEAASASTSATRPRYTVRLANPDRALRTQGDAVLYIQRGAGNVVASISIEYKRDNVHHSLAKPHVECRRQDGALSHIPILDHGAPVPLQDLEEETSKGADAVATKAIIQCVSSDSRFFLLVSIPFFQIGELGTPHL